MRLCLFIPSLFALSAASGSNVVEGTTTSDPSEFAPPMTSSTTVAPSTLRRADDVISITSASASETAPQVESRGRRGLTNLGATCYLAASLQALLHSRDMRDAIMNAGGPIDIPAEASELDRTQAELFNNLLSLYMGQWGDHGTETTPMSLRAVLTSLRALAGRGFGESEMEDAHEAIRLLLSSVSGALERYRGDRRIADLFSSKIVTTRTCNECSVGRSTSEELHEILIPMDPKSPMMTLMKGFEMFFKTGTLPGVDCPGCAAKTDHEVVARFGATPRLLLVSLKRFTSDGRKIKAFVYNPLEVDLSQMAGAGEGRYRLIGIIHHHGETIHGGHYNMDFVHPDDGKWYHADDATVSPMAKFPAKLGATQTVFLYERID